jgi:hypothetical protein|tara:strand:- start:263 stop:1666 length:1404 start_codon:yes stop_codon:yes gene_type:complete
MKKLDALIENTVKAMVKEKAVSKQQQKFFGVVKAMQKGDIPKKGKAGDAAKDMTKKDVDKYASTKHKGLPQKVDESTSAYGAALKALERERQLKMLSTKDKETLKKLADLMKKHGMMDKDSLKEYTDNNFSGAKLISDMASEKPDSEDMEFITKYFPNAVKSMSKAKANLQASDNSPIKKRMGQYAPMFVHVQYHTFTETSGQTFGVHQTQYYNSNFKDKPGGENFNPRVTELNFFGGEDQNDKMGAILATTDEYIKDLRDLERLGMLGKRVSESLNEDIDKNAIRKQIAVIDKQIETETGGFGEPLTDETLQALEQERERLEKLASGLSENDKFYDADKEQKHDEEDMPGAYHDDGQPINEGRGLDEASKLIKHLREKVYRKLNDQELEEFTKEMVDHLGGTINENKMNAKTESIVKRLKEDTEYQKFFKSALKKFDISSPADLKNDKKKKEFFNYVDKNYKAKSE